MYQIIENHKNPREIYIETLQKRGEMEGHLADQMEKMYWDVLQARLDLVKEERLPYTYQEPEQAWRSLKKTKDAKDFLKSPISGISETNRNLLIKHLLSIPQGFSPLTKVNRLLKGKQTLLDQGKLDWAMGELLAYGSILLDGQNVRLSGQDVQRGTFSHRHAIFRDATTGEPYNRLDGIAPNQGIFRIYNSLLSEFAVLGFEYGYALSTPDTLVIWEAQFGDFSNGAQTITDQFIMAGESKWQRMNGIVMLLPHGYEGQGPEHSSARLERFLQGCADNNVTVANISTPANFFHVLRRQLIRPFRKPLIVMSPKSLLRHPECTSTLDAFVGNTSFQEVLDDPSSNSKSKFRKTIFCSGKIYYDLSQFKEKYHHQDVRIVRIEQLYPLPEQQIAKYFSKMNSWVQEEPANMGAFAYLYNIYGNKLNYISRKASASPATGFKALHDSQQEAILREAFE